VQNPEPLLCVAVCVFVCAPPPSGLAVHPKVVDLLVRAGADVNGRDGDGCPPIVNLIVNGVGDARERLGVLLRQEQLDLTSRCVSKCK
jgi:hypothetical protein